MCHPLESDFDMSRKISDRVWQHSNLSGANKLLLLALAEQADDDGFTWVGYKTLAPMLGVIERQVYRLVDNLIEKGELLVWEQQGQHGGRGYTNIYLVTTGLTQEQIAETIKRRFDLVSDEIEAVITKKGDTYIKLCDAKRISPTTLERTRKVDTYVIPNQKPDTNVTLNLDKGDECVTQLSEAEPVKPDTNVTRLLKESLKQESNPSKESKREAIPQKPRSPNSRPDTIPAARTFVEVTGKHCLNKTQINVLSDRIGNDPAALEKWRSVVEAWLLAGYKLTNITGMLDWYKDGIPQKKNGVTQNGHYSKSDSPRNTDPDRIPSIDIFEDGWQPPSRSMS
jgi:predicted transcriptional regulator